VEILIEFLVSMASKLFAAEIGANAPRWSGRLIEHAVGRLPEQERTRYREEWFAHLDETPGALGKLKHALGCVFAARKVARARRPLDPSTVRNLVMVVLLLRHSGRLISELVQGRVVRARWLIFGLGLVADLVSDVMVRTPHEPEFSLALSEELRRVVRRLASAPDLLAQVTEPATKATTEVTMHLLRDYLKKENAKAQ
jgi:hypothetical protein